MPEIPDRRLELMLVCAHPAIAAEHPHPADAAGRARRRRRRHRRGVRGAERPRWPSGWCGPRSAFATRASRSRCPSRADLDERLPAVLEAVYGAYAIDWQLDGQGAPIETLSAEALHLALVLAELLPDEPEVLGLAALVCLSEARRPARRTAGRFVPLDEQDATRWDSTLIARGEAHAATRARFRAAGPLPVRGGDPVGTLQQGVARATSTSRRCARCTGRCCRWRRRWARRWRWPRWRAEIDGPDAGLRALDAIDDPAVERFQPAWTTRAHLLARRRTDRARRGRLPHRHRADHRPRRRRVPA